MRQLARRGFTLIELLVVISIIVLLATILLPMVNHAYTQAKRASMAADLLVISQALEAYKADFGDYPRRDRNPPRNLPIVIGAPLLCWALVAPGPAIAQPYRTVEGPIINPGDGADGPGFRIRGTTGPVKGPYLPPDRFRIGTMIGGTIYPPGDNPVNHGQASFNDAEDVLADRNYSPIPYFPQPRAPRRRQSLMDLLVPGTPTRVRRSSILMTTRSTSISTSHLCQAAQATPVEILPTSPAVPPAGK